MGRPRLRSVLAAAALLAALPPSAAAMAPAAPPPRAPRPPPGRRSALARLVADLSGLAAAGTGALALAAEAASPPPAAAAAAAAAAAEEDGRPALYLARPTGPAGAGAGAGAEPDGGSRAARAPIECLLPAARVVTYVDAAAEAVEKGEAEAMERLLGTGRPRAFVSAGDPARRIDASGPGLILDQAGNALRKQKEREENGIEVGLAPRAFEVLNLSDERRQWNILQRQEKQREQASEVRRAFNIYTSNLVFGSERYEFSGSREEKKQLVRADRMPTVTSVIRSDLDLRDLYRNQVQTALDDAWAEYAYQISQVEQGEKFDGAELLALLQGGRSACGKWLSFIPDRDVEIALGMVRSDWSGSP